MTSTWHQFSFRLAWRVSGLMLLLLMVATLAGFQWSWWISCMVSLLAGGVTYLVVYRLAARRLAQIHSTLDAIDRGDFESLPQVNTQPQDELDTLRARSAQTAASIRNQMEERERIEHYRREFLGNVSHELKTPIFSIGGFAETLLTGALDDKLVRRKFVERIGHNAMRLGNLAEDLAVVARIEMGELAMNVNSFSLHTVTQEVLETNEPLASKMNVSVRQSIPVDLPPVKADRERIGQVLSNLIDNAVKYCREGGQVEVSASLLSNGQIKVLVVDNGIGIPQHLIPRLTERFFRVDSSRSRSRGGTGLGLAIVKHILGAHETPLLIESTEGSGSTFGFTLPTDADDT